MGHDPVTQNAEGPHTQGRTEYSTETNDCDASETMATSVWK